MFVLEALLLTMATTPMTLWLYPMKYRARVTVTGQAFSNVEGEAADKQQITSQSSHKTFMGRFTVVLDKMENLPALMTLTQLLRAPYSHRGRASDDQRASTSSHTSYYEREESTVVIDALRLIELTDRTSALMRSSITEELIDTDPLINVFRTFGEINDIPVTASLSVLTHDAFSNGVAEHATARASDLIIVSWAPAFKSHEAQANLMVSATSTNPFDAFFKSSGENSTSYVHSHFLRKVFSDAEADVALYVDRGRNTAPSGGMGYQHIILPFFGGPDDRLALRFAIQLCANDNVTATIIRITKTDPSMAGGPDMPAPVHTTEDGGEAAALAAALRENNLTVQSVRALFYIQLDWRT